MSITIVDQQTKKARRPSCSFSPAVQESPLATDGILPPFHPHKSSRQNLDTVRKTTLQNAGTTCCLLALYRHRNRYEFFHIILLHTLRDIILEKLPDNRSASNPLVE